MDNITEKKEEFLFNYSVCFNDNCNCFDKIKKKKSEIYYYLFNNKSLNEEQKTFIKNHKIKIIKK